MLEQQLKQRRVKTKVAFLWENYNAVDETSFIKQKRCFFFHAKQMLTARLGRTGSDGVSETTGYFMRGLT